MINNKILKQIILDGLNGIKMTFFLKKRPFRLFCSDFEYSYTILGNKAKCFYT